MLDFEAVRAQSYLVDEIALGYSRGKDAIAMLDVCMKHFKTVHAYYLQPYCHKLDFIEDSLKTVEKYYGIEITRLYHPDLTLVLKYGMFGFPDPSVPIITFSELRDWIREFFDVEFIAVGERVADSLWRRAKIVKSGHTDFVGRMMYPLSRWTKNDVLSYIAKHRPPFPAIEYGLLGGKSWDGMLSSQDLEFVKINYPNDFAKILREMPFVETLLLRDAQIYEPESLRSEPVEDN